MKLRFTRLDFLTDECILLHALDIYYGIVYYMSMSVTV